MPKLPTFQADVGRLPISGGRRADASDFGGDIGTALGSVAKAGRQVYADIEESESRTALIESSAIRAKYAKRLDDAAISGEDLEAIKQAMNDELSKVGEGFATRRGQDALSNYTSNTNLMYDQQANAITVRRAASEARLGAQKFLTSTAALIQTNPLYLSEAERNAEALGDTFTRISPEQRAEIVNGLKLELNQTAAVAAARDDPEGTKKRLQAGEWTLTGDQRSAAISRTDSEIRAKRADEAYQREEQRRLLLERDDSARDKHYAAIIGGTASRRSIMDDADLRPATREHLINIMEQRAKELKEGVKKSDPVVMRDLWLRIHAPDTDERKIFTGDAIFQAVEKGQLNTTDANQLNVLVANQKDENNRTIGSKLGGMMSIVGRALSQDPSFTAQPALVAEIQMDYQARVFDKVDEMRKSKQNPNEAFNPASKDYVGSREFIQGSIDAARGRMQAAALKPGAVVTKDGVQWEFIGGDPRQQSSWRPAGESDLVRQIPR